MQGKNVLTVSNKKDGYTYRVVNDTNDNGDRIAMFQDRGWEFETDSAVRVGDRRAGVPSSTGTPIRASVGGGMYGYVMRIPTELFEEDQAMKEADLAESETQIFSSAKGSADYGSVELQRK
jgi:hypothetical protein